LKGFSKSTRMKLLIECKEGSFMFTSNVRTRRSSRIFTAWLIVMSMLISMALVLGMTGKTRADVDTEETTWSVTVDLRNGDEMIIIPVKDGDNTYDVVLAMLQEEDPDVKEVPDPEWDHAHKFTGWYCNDEPFDLHTPIHKNTMIYATWEEINGGWEIDLEANSRFGGMLTDKGAEFNDLVLNEEEDYSLLVSFLPPQGAKAEDAIVSLDGGKTWEDFTKYANPKPRENGRIDGNIPFRCELKEIEDCIPDVSCVSWTVQCAMKEKPDEVAVFVIDFFPENFQLVDKEKHVWYQIENWVIKIKEITITYDGNGGVDQEGRNYYDLIHNAPDPMKLNKNSFTKDGYRFIAWSTGKEKLGHLFREDHELPGWYFNGDMNFYAQWAEEDMYIVNFETAGGSDVDAQMVKVKGKIVKPEDPQKEGMVFKFWTLIQDEHQDRPEFDFSTKIKEDTVLFAVWEEAAPEPTYEFGDFVERLYKVALGRDSEPEGKAFWIEKVQNGEYTGGYCALFFLTGPEFLEKKTTDEEFMSTVYATFFDREPEPAGLEFWLKYLKDGGDRKSVVENFVDSKEWCNLCAKYNVKSGAPTAKAEIPSEKAKAFVERLYTKCLGRDAEEKGLEFWSLKLTNLEASGAELARDFFGSKEYVNKKRNDEEYVKDLYLTFMDRDAEEEGLNYWVGQIHDGMERIDVLRGFVVSEEFTKLCAEYGFERGMV